MINKKPVATLMAQAATQSTVIILLIMSSRERCQPRTYRQLQEVSCMSFLTNSTPRALSLQVQSQVGIGFEEMHLTACHEDHTGSLEKEEMELWGRC